MAKDQYYYGVGRRKGAIATARIYDGDGTITVNDKPLNEYFLHDSLQERLKQPLTTLDKESAHNVTVRVRGGGKSGQVDAIKLAIANALTELSEDLRPTLKRAGLLKRDARVKERKKYGLKRARKAPQFTKR